MNTRKFGAAMIAAGSLLLSGGSLRAEPPPPMWMGSFNVPVVVCDTKQQAVAIAKAGQDSSEALVAKYQELVATKNDKGASSCVSSELSHLVVTEREDFGMAHAGDGDLMHIWVVHGGTYQHEFWFIYAQSEPQTNA